MDQCTPSGSKVFVAGCRNFDLAFDTERKEVVSTFRGNCHFHWQDPNWTDLRSTATEDVVGMETDDTDRDPDCHS